MEPGLAGNLEQLIRLKSVPLWQRPQQQLEPYNLLIKIYDRLHMAGEIMIRNDRNQSIVGESDF
ncbi:hypothetical protein D3C73_1578480 [compost metagenome]